MGVQFFKKKVLPMALSAAMMLSATPVLAAANDLDGHWAKNVITEWQEKGLIKGYADGTFQPNNSITRAEFVVLMNNAQGFSKSAEIHFTDVAEGSWYYDAVAKAVRAGYTKGYEDGSFQPNKTITRAEAAVMIANAMGLSADESGAAGFTDAAAIPAWAKGSIGAAANAGYLSGYPDGSFGATKSITRAEAVSSLNRTLGNAAEAPAEDETQTEDKIVTEAGTTLADETISGDLIIAESVGDGDVYLDNVEIAGDLIVKGGGANSIHFHNSKIGGRVDLQKTDVHLHISGDSSISQIDMSQPSRISFGEDFSGTVENVNIPEGAENGDYTIESENSDSTPVENLNVNAETNVNVNSNVSNMNMGEGAEGSTVNVDKDATVDSMQVDAAVEVKGEGKVDSMEVSASGVTTGENLTTGDITTSNGASAPTTSTDSTTDSTDSKTDATTNSSSSSGGSSSGGSSNGGGSNGGSSNGSGSNGGSSSGGESNTPSTPTKTEITVTNTRVNNCIRATLSQAISENDFSVTVKADDVVLTQNVNLFFSDTYSDSGKELGIDIATSEADPNAETFEVTLTSEKYTFNPATFTVNIHDVYIDANGTNEITAKVGEELKTQNTAGFNLGNVSAVSADDITATISPAGSELTATVAENGTNGLIVTVSGTPAQRGSYTCTISVPQDAITPAADCTAKALSATFSITVKQPTITDAKFFLDGKEVTTVPHGSKVTVQLTGSDLTGEILYVKLEIPGEEENSASRQGTIQSDTEVTCQIELSSLMTGDYSVFYSLNGASNWIELKGVTLNAGKKALQLDKPTGDISGAMVGIELNSNNTITFNLQNARSLDFDQITASISPSDGGLSVGTPTQKDDTGTDVTISGTPTKSGTYTLTLHIPKEAITPTSLYDAVDLDGSYTFTVAPQKVTIDTTSDGADIDVSTSDNTVVFFLSAALEESDFSVSVDGLTTSDYTVDYDKESKKITITFNQIEDMRVYTVILTATDSSKYTFANNGEVDLTNNS